MITLTTSQCSALQQHVDAILSILRSAAVSEDAPSVESSAVTAKPHIAQPPKRRSAKITQATFRYNYAPQHAKRIVNLYQHLLRAKWIAKETSPDDFCAVFSGEPSHAKVKWAGTQQHLFYLIRTLSDRRLITMPDSIGIWQITESHFLNKNSRPFHNFNKQKEPAKAKLAIERLVDMLDPAIS